MILITREHCLILSLLSFMRNLVGTPSIRVLLTDQFGRDRCMVGDSLSWRFCSFSGLSVSSARTTVEVVCTAPTLFPMGVRFRVVGFNSSLGPGVACLQEPFRYTRRNPFGSPHNASRPDPALRDLPSGDQGCRSSLVGQGTAALPPNAACTACGHDEYCRDDLKVGLASGRTGRVGFWALHLHISRGNG